MENTYKASLDKTTKTLTIAGCSIAAFVLAGLFLTDIPKEGVITGLCICILIIGIYFFSVKSYQITEDKLIIKRPISILDKKIPLSKIQSVKLLNKDFFKDTVRTIGNGGLFGYSGLYTHTNLGNFWMYATNGKTGILIVFKDKGKKIVISPDDAAMADDLQKRLKEGV